MKSAVFNTRERLISNDHNRLQSFVRRGVGNTLRYMLNARRFGVGETRFDTTLIAPASGEIYNGLCAVPQTGSASLLIEPGVVGLVDPTGDTDDDSAYKVIEDPGVLSVGTLALASNTSGLTRIDVIECARQPAKFTTSDSRDIFDNATGSFTAAAVVKTSEDGLQYRIRSGTPGAGFPGVEAGWLPLAVAIVPSGSTTWDTVDLFDVRPLLSDRPGVSNDTTGAPSFRASRINGVNATSMFGSLDVVYQGRKLGGAFTGFNARSATNQSPGMSFAATNTLWYLYLVTPHGLPRWARYTTSGTRVPSGTRGIMVVSPVAPDADGQPTSAVSLPMWTGLSATTAAVCVAAGTSDGTNALAVVGDDRSGHVFASTATAGTMTVNALSSGAGSTFANATYQVAAGAWPAHAKSAIIEIRADLTVDAPGYALRQTVTVYDPVSGGIAYVVPANASAMTTQAMVAVNDPAGNVSTRLEIPLAYLGSGAPGATVRIDVKWESNGTLMSFGSGQTHLRVIGYRL